MKFSVDRRTFLAGASTIPLSLASGNGSLAVARDAKAQDVNDGKHLFGAAVQARHILVDEGFRNAVIRECGAITPELEFKWDFIEAERGQLNFRPGDQLVRFAMENGLRIHGHTLIWHRSTPAWAIEQMLETSDWTIVSDYFGKIIPRFAHAVESWDVVNEPFEPFVREDGLRPSSFLSAFGPDYMRRAFEEAAELAPGAVLYLNEFGLIYGGPEAAAKRETALRVLEQLVGSGVPVGGLGIQGHLDLRRMASFDAESFSRFMSRVAGLGLKLRISELDVAEGQTDIPAEERDAHVGEAVREMLAVAADNRALVGVTSWGLSDRYSWLQPHNAAAGLNRGLPLDSNLRQKPMYRAIRESLTL